MATIKSITAREILDSRGIPTIEAVLTADSGQHVVTSVPAGTSTGKHEARELRDMDPRRYGGMGVLKAVTTVNKTIAPKIIGLDPRKQSDIDRLLIQLDGSSDKHVLGANSILSVSQGSCELAAAVSGQPTYRYMTDVYQLSQGRRFPTPIFNIINGGKHGAGNLDIQEFHVATSVSTEFPEALRIGEEIYQHLGQVLAHRGAIHSVGVEGGYAPNLYTNKDALEIMLESVSSAGFSYARDVFFGLDVAANSFYERGKYRIKDRSEPLSRADLISYFKELNDRYHLIHLEDPLFEDDFDGWAQLTSTLSQESVIIGDDLLTTNPDRVADAIEKKLCTGVLVKPNQIGTITETIDVIKKARVAGWQIIVSHRSGETNEDFIADFAVGVGAEYVKFGAPARGERVAKYNRLLEIFQEFNSSRS